MAASSPTPSSLASFPHKPTDPVSTIAIHKSHSHLNSLSSLQARPHSPPPLPQPSSPATRTAAEAAFYRRILFAHLTPTQLTPPLTGQDDVDHQLHLLLAYLLRETVLPWYSKLTPDRELLTQITQIISHVVSTVTDNLGRRSRSQPQEQPTSDFHRLHELLGKQLPVLLRQHYRDVRMARAKAGSAWAPLTAGSIDPTLLKGTSDILGPPPRIPALPSTIFDAEPEPTISPLLMAHLHSSLCPHPALNRDEVVLGKIDPVYLRIAISSLLGSLLPPQEWQPDVEKFIVRDVAVSVVKGSLGKCTRPWFFVQSLHKVLDVLGWTDGRRAARTDAKEEEKSPRPPLTQQVLTAVFRIWSLLTILCTMILPHLVRMYLNIFNPHPNPSHGRHRNAAVSQEGDEKRYGSIRRTREGSAFEKKMHGRFPSGMAATRQSPLSTSEPSSEAQTDEKKAEAQAPILPAAEYSVAWLQLLEEVTEARTHTLSSSLFSMARIGLGFAGFGKVVDGIITAEINKKLGDTKALAKVIQDIRLALLPNGHLPPAVPDPTEEMQAAEWKRLRRRLIEGMNPRARMLLLGPTLQAQHLTMTRCLSPICAPDAAGPNTHLAVMLLERVMVTLCPDLVE